MTFARCARVFAIVCSGLICAGLARAANPALDDRSLAELLGWAAHFSGRPVPDGATPPPTIAMTAAQLAQTVCPLDVERCHNVVAAYDAGRGRIVHLETFDAGNPIDRSFLVHELVHYLQHLQGGDAFSTAGCRASLASEREAYRAQNRYLAHVGQVRRVGQALFFAYCDPGDAGRAARDEAAAVSR